MHGPHGLWHGKPMVMSTELDGFSGAGSTGTMTGAMHWSETPVARRRTAAHPSSGRSHRPRRPGLRGPDDGRVAGMSLGALQRRVSTGPRRECASARRAGSGSDPARQRFRTSRSASSSRTLSRSRLNSSRSCSSLFVGPPAQEMTVRGGGVSTSRARSSRRTAGTPVHRITAARRTGRTEPTTPNSSHLA